MEHLALNGTLYVKQKSPVAEGKMPSKWKTSFFQTQALNKGVPSRPQMIAAALTFTELPAYEQSNQCCMNKKANAGTVDTELNWTCLRVVHNPLVAQFCAITCEL